MNSLAKPGRVIRAAAEHEDLFILGESRPSSLVPHASIATAGEIREAADVRSSGIIAAAERQAAAILADAQSTLASLREAAYQDGYRAGREAADNETAGLLQLARAAASDGKAIRDSIAAESAAVVARAVALATRRVVGEYYEADPERTTLACAEALRAASGQEVLSIRVHPGLADSLRATLTGAASYIVPDGSIEAGGCIIDLRNGTLDASLDARLSLMDLALAEAGGQGEA